MINNIENHTISEIDAKKDLNTLNKIKNAELKKYKIRTPTQKDLLNLFDDLLKTMTMTMTMIIMIIMIMNVIMRMRMKIRISMRKRMTLTI